MREGAKHLVIQLLAMGIPVASLPLVTRLLQPSEFGIVELFLAAGNFLTPLFSAGFDQVLINDYFRRTFIERRNLISQYTGYIGIVSVIIILLLFITATPLQYFLHLPYLAIVSLGPYVCFGALIQLGQAIALMERRTIFLGLFIIGKSGFAYIIALPLIVFWPSWSMLLIANLFIVFSLAIISLFLLQKFNLLAIDVSPRVVAIIWRLGGILVLMSVFVQLLTITDRFFIQYFLGIEYVGIYTIPYRLMNGCFMLVIALSRASVPWIVEEITLSGPNQNRVVAALYLYWLIIISGFGLAAVLGGRLLQLITSSEYHSGASLIPMLAVAFMFNSLFIFNSSFLIFQKREKIITIAVALAWCVNIILNLLLIPHFGLYGAAIAAIVTYATLSLIAFILLIKLGKLPWIQGIYELRNSFSLLITNFTKH